MLANKLLMANPQGGGSEVAEGVSFDGVTDYMSRSTDLVGNVDSKTFTFSCWVYYTGTQLAYGVLATDSTVGDGFGFIVDDTGFRLQGENTSGANILAMDLVNIFPLNTWVNILGSFDLTSASLRHLFVNDKAVSPNYTTYLNQNIDFTKTDWYIGGNNTSLKLRGRLSNLFLDYTYRDLSIEANRRLFITADGKPADGLELVDKYLDNKFYVGGEEASPRDILFNQDGTVMYVIGSTGNDINMYNLSIAYDITTAVFNSVALSVSAQDSFPVELEFNSDGSKIYILGLANNKVFEYNLSTNYLVSSATYSTFYSYTNTTGSEYGLKFNNDGSKMYLSDSGTALTHTYTLSTPFLVSSATHTSSSLKYFTSITFNNNGSKFYGVISDDYVEEYNLSIAYDLTTATYTTRMFFGSQETTGMSVIFNSDGNKMYIMGIMTDSIYQYTLSTPYDISTAVYGQPSNNPQQPILYLPMKDAATAHINEGTGGDFVQNGLIETADRGANQDNCVASKFDGSDDTLKNISFPISDGTNSFTVSYIASPEDNRNILTMYNGTSLRLEIEQRMDNVTVYVYNNSTTLIRQLRSPEPISGYGSEGWVGKTHFVTISIDLTNEIYKISHNNIVYDMNNLITPISGSIGQVSLCEVATQGSSEYKGTLGELYFDTNYIDLATDNPFWGSDNNRPKPVRQVLEETGANPLIAMPIDASNPTKNYGSVGDFTLNGALVGARGGSEYWARSAYTNFTGSWTVGNYLSLVGDSVNYSTFSLCCKTYNVDNTRTTNTLITLGSSVNENSVQFLSNASEDLAVRIGGSEQVLFSGVFSAYGQFELFAKLQGNVLWARLVEPDGTVSITTKTLNGVVLDVIYILGCPVSEYTNAKDWAGDLSGMYFTTDYIDFSQESNRNLFVNQLGFPRSLEQPIADGLIPEPLIYLDFSDTSNLGLNKGTGGDFLVVGDVQPGSDFSIN